MYPVIDMHCDTIYSISNLRQAGTPACLRGNDLHIDLLRMKQSGYLCQSFALFSYLQGLRENGIDPFDYALSLSDLLDEELAANADLIRPVLSASEMISNHEAGMMSALKTIEEGGVYKGDPELVRFFYDKGVRKSTLTWNFENELAWPNRLQSEPLSHDPVLVPETERGLKPAGREVVQLMEELGMIIDVSHLGDKGIYDVFDLVRKDTPVIASHSNARAVTPHPRNLTDDMLKLMADHGGVTGINYCPAFLTSDGENKSRIMDMIAHIRHIRNVAGIDVIGLGSDFDGIGGDLELNGAGDMQKLADALSLAGFTTTEIEKIFWRNTLQVYQTVLG